MLYRQCARCKTIVKQGTRCPKCKQQHNKAYDLTKRDKTSKKFYESNRWRKLSKQCRDRAYGLDEYEYYINHRIVLGELTHHIIEISEDMTKAFDINNLIYLSHKTHNMIHKLYQKGNKSKQKIQKILKKIVEMRRGEVQKV